MPRAKASRGAMMRNRAAAVGHGRQGGAAGLGIDRRTGGRQRGTTVSFYGHNYYAKRGEQEEDATLRVEPVPSPASPAAS